ncbi:uncharacterized protein LOC131848864 [Achroia grisella]|uniref:uncharacterized protein LOC131848864 n=1 Tax=Achroia grisella TaxID=688607 RepID=UPI0027D24BB7|nr:uncharacterized protein LOC131848864 [Achroia grisella]
MNVTITNNKFICDVNYGRYSKTHIGSNDRPFGKRIVTHKKLVTSKNIHTANSKNGKSYSAGIINEDKLKVIRPKKTTKSTVSVHKTNKIDAYDHSKGCGDTTIEDSFNSNSNNVNSKIKQYCDTRLNSESKSSNYKIKNDRPSFGIKPSKSLRQCYRNENFHRSSDSIGEIESNMRRISLNTIKELPEVVISDSTASHVSDVFNIYSDSEELGYLNINNEDTIKKIKEFRDNNYFECHSAKSRIESKVSVTNLIDHKCSYRFYLNDRLFPIPICTDHQNNIRCVECHLPMTLKNEGTHKINGTIQAKTRIGDDQPQDTILFLPINEHLIIKERKNEKRREEDMFYFGIIKLGSDGNSVFNQTTPSNSLALRYQKGYKDHSNSVYRFENIDQGDVIVI